MFGLEIPILNAIVAGIGLIMPPAFDFIKKKFIKTEDDTPERTMSTLATTKPEILAEYVNSTAKLMESKIKWFNRDVIGLSSKWVVDLRASIRPIAVVLSLLALVGAMILPEYVTVDEGIKVFMIGIVSEWFGERLVLK